MSKIHALSLAGQRFGRLLVLSRSHADKVGAVYWLCKCDCGEKKTVRANTLRSGRTQSCGCLHRERITVHGMTKTPTWKTWDTMIQRCENPNAPDYSRYGGRGITVCARWHDFLNFLSDMGYRPEGKTLDRVQVDGNYEPENCKWSTASEQQRNRTDAITATVGGVTRNVWDWAELVGIPGGVIKWRLGKGWPDEKAVRTPVRAKKPSPRKGLT